MAIPRPPSTCGRSGGLGVHAQTGLGDAAQAGDGPLALRTELQLDDELLAHLGVLFLVVGDVALGLEDVGDADLQLGRRHLDGVMEGRVGIAQTRQHVCDRICHGHVGFVPFLVTVSLPGSPVGTCDVDI